MRSIFSSDGWPSLGLAGSILLAGCGAAATPCGPTSYNLSVAPTTAVLDHAAAAPANQVRFEGSASAVARPGCAVSALSFLEYAAWTNPDPLHITISSANDETNGTAICNGATSGAVTLTGAFSLATLAGPAGSGPNTTVRSVLLTCK